MSAEIEGIPNTTTPVSARVWNISPLGIEVLLNNHGTPPKGRHLDIALRIGNQVSRFEGVVVASSHHEQTGQTHTGIRFYTQRSVGPATENRRDSTRWNCSPNFYPVAIAPNPMQFNDFIYISIRDVSARGMKALTSLRNKFLVPDITLSWQISFPLTGHITTDAKVVRAKLVGENGKDFLELGLEFESLDKRQRQTVGQYLIQFSDAESPSQLRSDGLYPISLERGIDYSYIKSSEDFTDVLELRLLANRRASKIPDSYSNEDMSDVYDARSRIIIGRHNGKAVATARLTIPDQNESLEIEELHRIPEQAPRKDQLVEVARAATHPDFRRGSMWYSLVQQLAVTTLQANRSFALISTTAELVQMYEALGFSSLNDTYLNPLYPEKTQHVMLLDINQALNGVGIGPAVWYKVWRPVLDHLSAFNMTFSGVQKTRTSLYRIIGPIALALAKVAKKPR